MPDYQSAYTGQQIDDAIAEILSGSIGQAAEDAKQAAQQSAQSANASAGSAKQSSDSATASAGSAKTSQSYAVGGTGSRIGEDTDNAKHYATQASEATKHAPRITLGTWWIWDATQGDYTNTGVNATGPQGKTGPQGATGPQGEQGVQGEVGPIGPVGPVGPQGVVGPQGEQGIQGEQGLQGPPGKDGTSLYIEDTYSTLEALRQAIPSGDKNMYYVQADGNCYIYSEQINDWVSVGQLRGPEGPQGIQGIQGETGPQGAVGPQGEVGPEGPVGATGPEGPVGPTGANGNDGAPGSNGVLITVTLLQSGWSGNRQTVSNPNLLVDGYAYVISPKDTSYSEYASSMIYAEDVATGGSITFVAGEVPSKDLTVNILRLELSKHG